MDPILGRSQFLSETVNLFTDEKTANARARVVEWINDINTSEPQVKCELLVKIQETIMSSCVELLEEFLEHILSLAHDTNMDVRKQVVGFMEQICKVKVEYLGQVVNVISMLLRDRSPQVIKRVIQASGSIYKNGLQWICSQQELTDSCEQAWNVLSLIKAQILDLIDNENDGIRTNAIKFLEGVVVLQSYPDEDSQKRENDFSLENIPESLKIIKRKKLEEEALNIFDILLKFHAATHISSVNLIACTGSLCTIAKLRPSLMGPVIEAFKSLNSNLPPTLTDSQVSSVRKSLKMQLMALLKNKGSYEYQSVIKHLLNDLGASQGEVQRAIPKMDKQEQMRRQKRILENATSNLHKKMRLGKAQQTDDKDETQEMVVDEEELEKQRQKSTKVNEKFLAEHLRSTNTVVNLVVEYLPKLPDTAPEKFLQEYTPIKDLSIAQQVSKISNLLGQQMTEQKIGPGSAAFTKEVPMKVLRKDKATSNKVIEEVMEVEEPSGSETVILDDEQQRKEEATKKLRENMERMKGEQELIERMKQKAKALKLQEITKPFPRPLKEKFLMDAVKRILHAERQCIVGGVSAKRRKILTVMAATFPDNVRYFIFEFIMMDIKQRIDLAFSWLYEEYCLLQGFTRHSYVKSENRPDHAYNELLGQIIMGIINKCELRDKILLLRRVYLEAPLLPDESLKPLLKLILMEEYSAYGLDLLKELAILRPPRKAKFLRHLLNFCIHERLDIREKALEHIVTLYTTQKLLSARIDEFALELASYLEKEIPPASMFGEEYGRPGVETAWREEIAKICLIMLLTLAPHRAELYLEKLTQIYSNTSADLKRTILRSIDPAIKKLGAENPLLLQLIEDSPKGCETLIIRIIYILTERQSTPAPELVLRVKELYQNKIKDVRVLIPILSGLTRQEILTALPKLIKLNQVVVKEVFNRLLSIGAEFANQTMATTPSDILVALHTIDINECDLKCIVKATSLCLAEKEVFTQDVLIGVLQQLVEIVPIPTLLMRTIIQSLTLYPRMANFVLNILQRLILKQVWRQKVIWEGFLKCLQRLKPSSLPIMLHLPPQQLMNALEQCPDLRPLLIEYAQSIEEEPMSGITPQIMDIITGKAVDVFITDDTGGFISVENIKKEVDEPMEISTISTVTTVPVPLRVRSPDGQAAGAAHDVNQPLPPGED
ncbi:Symplekin [Lucilia cuprina]|uniref:Symplekin n=1 Tax=Lucilia cuprina TaxID=7375 RepID=A0A0L0CD71_LUCCU|nr:Symplekin [Lucilia cuprina]KNC30191.1 Symplekin [Lucilia cuprina]